MHFLSKSALEVLCISVEDHSSPKETTKCGTKLVFETFPNFTKIAVKGHTLSLHKLVQISSMTITMEISKVWGCSAGWPTSPIDHSCSWNHHNTIFFWCKKKAKETLTILNTTEAEHVFRAILRNLCECHGIWRSFQLYISALAYRRFPLDCVGNSFVSVPLVLMSLTDETAEPAPNQDWLKMYHCEGTGVAKLLLLLQPDSKQP